MDIINEAYKTSQQLAHLKESGGAEDKMVIDMIRDLKSGNIPSYGAPDTLGDFIDDMGLTGSSNFKFSPVKKAKSYLSKVHTGLLSYLKSSLVEYVKKQKDTFSGFEGLMLALDLQGNKDIFGLSDFNIKGAGEYGADRVVVSLMYGGDRLKAFEKYGNIPRSAWKKLLLKNGKNFEDYGTKEWLAAEIGMPETSDVNTIIGAAILKYKL